MTEPLHRYPPPETHPDCKCWPDLLKAHFCQTGHMTECHWPHRCADARCAHLAKYDLETDYVIDN